MDVFDDFSDKEYPEDEDYIYASDSMHSIIEKIRKKLNERVDPNYNPEMWLEQYSFYEAPIEIKKRNMDKFDRLTQQGYMLDLVTGQFKLSAWVF